MLTGKDKGKTGSIVKSFPKMNRVVVEGLNLMKVHQKPRRAGEKGQIVELAMPIHVSNVALSGKTSKPKKAAKAKK